MRTLRARNEADRRLRVVIAGSRSLPAGTAVRLLIRFVAALPKDSIILVRSRAAGSMGEFESDVVGLAKLARLPYQPCAPWPVVPEWDEHGDSYIGREGVLLRDRTMVDVADVVLAFVTARELESEDHSGTRHLVEAAFARDKPVFLYEVDDEGNATQVGSNDPDNSWTARVPG